MPTQQIPSSEFKFLKTTDKKICPKCGSTDVFNTGHRADNIDPRVSRPEEEPKHPVYRCAMCAQLFRLNKPEK
jgi:hypothetical protein